MNTNNHRTLLVVDDEPQMRDLLSEEIGKEGYRVLQAENFDTAMTLIETEQIHACLCDLAMPGRDGLDLLTKIRTKGFDFPFIFISGYESYDSLLTALRLGAADFLSKTTPPGEVVQAVTRALEIGVSKSELAESIGQFAKEGGPNHPLLLKLHQVSRKIALLQVAATKDRSGS